MTWLRWCACAGSDYTQWRCCVMRVLLCGCSAMYQENERRLAAAAAAKEVEEREAAARRHVKRAPYKPGGLSAEEKVLHEWSST